jgi:hypothetical protein
MTTKTPVSQSAAFVQATKDAWADEAMSPEAIASCIASNLQALGHTPDSPFGIEYAAVYRDACGDFGQLAEEIDLDGPFGFDCETTSPEEQGSYDAWYDYGDSMPLRCSPEIAIAANLKRDSQEGNADYVRRYTAAYLAAQPNALASSQEAMARRNADRVSRRRNGEAATFDTMTDDELRTAARRIVTSSSSESEVQQRLANELKYPYSIAITSSMPTDRVGFECRAVASMLGGLTLASGAMVMVSMHGHDGTISL